MVIKSYKPALFLSKYIDRIYILKKHDSKYFNLPDVLPGTGLELLFHLDKPLSINNKELPEAHTVCPRSLLHFDQVKKVSYISVRFKSGAFRHFTSIPFSELNNSFFSVQKIWKEKGEGLLNKLGNFQNIENKVQEIESFLIEIFNQYHDNKNDKWDLIIDELYYNFDSYTIEKLSQKANLSLRHFERVFKSQFGINAKEFQKISRFQNVIKKILLDRKPDYLNTILDNGYFDQSHFIKEFKSLTNKTPSAYFTEENFANHFYHKSLNNNPITNNS